MHPLFIIIGPSGSGKTSVVSSALSVVPLKRAIIATTGAPRAGETPDDYIFLPPEEFTRIPLVETATYAGNMYGIPRKEIDSSDICILSPSGVGPVVTYCRSTGRDCYVIGITAGESDRFQRMIRRGDNPYKALDRVRGDLNEFLTFPLLCDVVFRNENFSVTVNRLVSYIGIKSGHLDWVC